ncbi:hypothetical protein [Rhodoglobus sp.]
MIKEGARISVRFSEREFSEVQTAAGGMATRDYLAALLNSTLERYEDLVLESAPIAERYLAAEQEGRESIARRRFGITNPDDIAILTASWVEHPKSAPKPAAQGGKGRRAALGYDQETARAIVRGHEAKVIMQADEHKALVAIAKMLEKSDGVGPTARKIVLGQSLFLVEDSTNWVRLSLQASNIIAEAACIRGQA